MGLLLEWLWNLTDAGVELLLSPFYYISIILIALYYRRAVILERKQFSVRINSWGLQIWRVIAGGLLAGIFVSVCSLLLGMTLSREGIWLLWAVTIILLLFRFRYLCFAYAVGILGIAQFIVDQIPSLKGQGWSAELLTTLRELNIPALLALVALLHLAEAALVRMQGGGLAGPQYYSGKRGKPIGGYQMESFWPLPLFLLIPGDHGGSILPWTPLFGGDAWQTGFSLLSLPVVIGFSQFTRSALPGVKARLSSGRLLAYGLLLLALALLARWWSPVMPVAALVALLLHEGLDRYSRYQEEEQSPLFVHPEKGLKILTVLPDSPAAELGIVPGETILRVNGNTVSTKEELHAALRINPAFCKLEVLNLSGESKFLQRAIYAGDHHQLGVILAPDQDATSVVRPKPVTLWSLFSPKRDIIRSKMEFTGTPAPQEDQPLLSEHAKDGQSAQL